MENQTRKKIQVLRTDNGGEYTSNEFMEYCSAEGIKEHTVPGMTKNLISVSTLEDKGY